MTYLLGDPREPDCIHSLNYSTRQPASACRICKDGPDILAWKKYWDEHQDLIPDRYKETP
jgi:hypothetical protein